MALTNFIEMRDKTASRAFWWRKKIEHTLHGLLPTAYVPLYDMVSFSTIPYAVAQQRARRQDRVVLAAACASAGVVATCALGAALWFAS
jgi:kynurenine 3-monooxygenase